MTAIMRTMPYIGSHDNAASGIGKTLLMITYHQLYQKSTYPCDPIDDTLLG
jgi:hypothetical protein